MKTLEIHKKIKYNGVELEVKDVKEFLCEGCYFFEMNVNCFKNECRKVIGNCDQYNRTDGKNVIFMP